MRVLVSGSSGLIGTALVAHLASEGTAVTRLVRGPGPVPVPERSGGSVSWDPAAGSIDRDGLEQAGPFDAVVHLAGAGIGDKRWSPARKQVILESRTASTRLLATTLATLSSPPPVLISASAVGWYGIRGDEALTEESSTGTDFLAEVCRAWEEATGPAEEAGIRTVHVRTGIVLARSGGALGKQLPLFRMGSGRQYRSWITLEDEVSVITYAIGDATLSGPVNATAPEPATDAELAKAIGAVLHRPTVVAVPAPALRLVLGTEMAEELILGGQRVLPAVLTGRGFTFAHTDLAGAVASVLRPG
jgi:uncharacterized protein (TIGR01777 family)